MAQRALGPRTGCAGERLVPPLFGFKSRVTEFERRQRLAEVAVVPFDENLAEQRRRVQGQLLARQASLVKVDQPIRANQALAIGTRANLDSGAAPGRADFKARPVFGEGVRPVLIVESHRDQELLFARLGIGVVYVANLLEVELVPKMIGGISQVTFIVVADGTPEGILGLGEFPLIDLTSILR